MAFKTPTIGQLRDVADELGFAVTDDYLADMQAIMEPMAGGYQLLDQLADNVPPLRYPRTPGYRPEGDDNPFGAWYVKTDIKGAPRGKLKGRPVAIKDNICVAGVPMMNGASILEGYVPEFDATVVTRILDAGGTIAGKLSASICAPRAVVIPVLPVPFATLTNRPTRPAGRRLAAGRWSRLAMSTWRWVAIRPVRCANPLPIAESGALYRYHDGRGDGRPLRPDDRERHRQCAVAQGYRWRRRTRPTPA